MTKGQAEEIVQAALGFDDELIVNISQIATDRYKLAIQFETIGRYALEMLLGMTQGHVVRIEVLNDMPAFIAF